MKQSNHINDKSHDSEQYYRDLIRQLPEPGPAYVAGRVMTRLRQPAQPVWQVRHTVWGVVGSLAGLALGFYFTGSAISTANGTITSNGDSYSELIRGADDGLDQLVADLFVETEE